jgi:acyl-CoA thioester hydrolase
MTKFRTDFSVRDYECDLQGVVNNAVYQHYLEHARHEFLKSINIDFAALTAKGLNLVVVRAELDYKFPLRSGDKFYVLLSFAQESRIRFAFYQDIFRSSEDKLIMNAKIIGTCINKNGRPEMPKEILAHLENNL